MPPTETEATEARLRTPLQARDVAALVRAGKSILKIKTAGGEVDIDFHRYVCRMENAYYGTMHGGLLSGDRETIIVPHPLPITPPLSGLSFGKVEKSLPDNRLRVHFPPAAHHVRGAAACLYFADGIGVFLFDAVLGLFRTRRMLDSDLPVLLPDTLNERFRSFLRLAGATDAVMIPVPRTGIITVERAFIPSRSSARDVRVRAGDQWIDLQYLVEPEDTLAFNTMIQSKFGGGPRRRLYLSREGAGSRRIENESEVIHALESQGFEPLNLATMPVDELVTAFANAELVVSPHGSALTNALFAPSTVHVIEIDHPRNDFVAHGICRTLGQTVELLGRLPQAARERGSDAPQSVDIGELETLVGRRIAALN